VTLEERVVGLETQVQGHVHSADRLLDEALPLAGLCGGHEHPFAHHASHAGVEEVDAWDLECLLASYVVGELDRKSAVLPVAGDDLAVLALQTGHPEHLRLLERVPGGYVCGKLLPGHA